MRRLMIVAGILGVALACSETRADEPATRPSDGVKVAVLPFDVIGDGGRAWVGQALQQGVANGMQNENHLAAILLPAVNPTDADAPRSAAQAVGADFVVFGNVQIVDEQMRVSGHILNVAQNKMVDGISMDASIRDLFSVEDILSHKAARLAAPVRVHKAVARPEIELRGPVAMYQSTYFDGNSSAGINTPEKWRDEYNRYYYRPSPDWCWGYGYGCYGGLYGVGYGYLGLGYSTAATPGWNLRPAAPISGW